MMMQTLNFPCILPTTVKLGFKCRATVQSLSPPKTSNSANLYEVLRVNRNASMVEIKAAYRNLAKVYHPDASSSSSSPSSASSSSSSFDSDDFIKIHNAYETLSDPAARALYDLSLGFGIGIGIGIENPYYPFSSPSSTSTSPFGCYSVGRRPTRRMDNRLTIRKQAARRRRTAMENAIIALGNRTTVIAPSSSGMSTFDRFNRHRPPTYEGTADPIVLENWLREMEKLFAATNCHPNEMVSIGTYYLKMEADNWWNTVKDSCLAETGFGWAQFANKLKERFYPDELRWQKQEEFLTLTQGSLSIQEYTDKFTALSRFATSVVPTESERVRRYVKKMDPRVRTHVLSSGASTFQKAYEMALSVHASIKEEESVKAAVAKRPTVTYSQVPAKRPRYDFGNRNNFQSGSGSRPSFGANKCRGCGKDFHPGKNCNGTTIICYHCNEVGHKSFECPKRKAPSDAARQAGSSGPPKNRIYVMSQAEADVEPDVITGEE